MHLLKKQQKPLKVGGMITITYCKKIQILRYAVRPTVRELIENDPEDVLVETEKRPEYL